MAIKGRIKATVGKVTMTLNGKTYTLSGGGKVHRVLKDGKWHDVKATVRKGKKK